MDRACNPLVSAQYLYARKEGGILSLSVTNPPPVSPSVSVLWDKSLQAVNSRVFPSGSIEFALEA